MTERIDRRRLFVHAGAAGIGVLATELLRAQTCQKVPPQTEGPFYPVTRRADEDFDLTQVAGRQVGALGDAVLVRGVVQNELCEPIPGTLVEIWQACAAGRYDHPDETNLSVPLDPNFQYWGRVTTPAAGSYGFKTVIPGLYPGRTRHIHFRVVAPNTPSLTTQMYFAGEPRNGSDAIYRSLGLAGQRLVTVEYARDPATGLRLATFNITLGRRGVPLTTPAQPD